MTGAAVALPVSRRLFALPMGGPLSDGLDHVGVSYWKKTYLHGPGPAPKKMDLDGGRALQ